jgi:LuxR family transcriptional activator of rhlAB and lasB
MLSLPFCLENLEQQLNLQLKMDGFTEFAYVVQPSTPFNAKHSKLIGTINEQTLSSIIPKLRSEIFIDRHKSIYWETDFHPDHATIGSQKVKLRFVILAMYGLDRKTHIIILKKHNNYPKIKYSTELKLKLFSIIDILTKNPLFKSPNEDLTISLSSRELEILRWVGDGKCSQTIASILGISQNTVNYHIKKIQKKYSSSNRVLAVAYSAAQGII